MAYSLAGAILFERLERSATKQQVKQERQTGSGTDDLRAACLDDLWNITGEYRETTRMMWANGEKLTSGTVPDM